MHTKVFVGNLSFKTKAEELAAEFSIAGRVVSANIITRGPRSLGYGFVEMESEEEAQKAVTLLNKKSVDSREINVELAKPREDKPPQERGERRPPRGGRGGRRGGRGGRGGNRGGSDNNNQPQGGQPQNNSNNNNQAAQAPQHNQPPQQGGQNNNQAQNSGAQGPRRPFRNRRFSNRGGGGNTGGNRENQSGGQASPQPGGSPNVPRERRPRGVRFNQRQRDFANRTPSPTTLFVANLPFALEDDGLLKLFKDLKVTKAHVVKNRNQRSKGFGFVEFANEADQKSALTAAEKMVVDQRELIVKVALTAPEPRENAGGAPAAASSDSSSSSAAAPAASSPATPAAAKEAQPAAKADDKSS